VLAQARRAGAEAAVAVVKRRERRLKARAAARAGALAGAASAGTLVAEGDSWFDYPLSDVLGELEDNHGWDVVSVAHKGDRVEDMAYGQGQFEKLERALRKLAQDGGRPKAILLSGGGNDIAGDEFAMLLNHKRSGLPPLNAQVVSGVFAERLRAAIVFLASGVTALCRELFGSAVPILMHGYDRPVPDGRGFLGGFWFLPGPWLEPGFRQKGYADLAETTAIMAELIDRFNEELSLIAGSTGLPHLTHVDLRGRLSNQLAGRAYRRDWANELHPTEGGFETVAAEIDRVLRTVV
jgi:lysophospholipase L1-like esterase